MNKALEKWLAAVHHCSATSQVRATTMAKANASVNKTLVILDQSIGPKQ
jgi:hypothetical protein